MRDVRAPAVADRAALRTPAVDAPLDSRVAVSPGGSTALSPERSLTLHGEQMTPTFLDACNTT